MSRVISGYLKTLKVVSDGVVNAMTLLVKLHST